MTEKKCKTRVYARVTGFYSSIEQFNPGKKEEVKERKHYDLGERDEKRT